MIKAQHLIKYYSANVRIKIVKRSANIGAFVCNALTEWLFLMEDGIFDDSIIDLDEMSEVETSSKDEEDIS